MKNSTKQVVWFVITILFLAPNFSKAQDFQRVYGDALDNSFSKVIQDAAGNFYVLGQNEVTNGSPQRATVTYLDANGNHQWTLSLDFASIWHDAVLTTSGELMAVGQTLPSDASSKAIMARVTAAGAFAKLRTYEETGRDLFTRIVRQSGTFPYFVIGAQFEAGGTPTTEDVVLFNLDQDLNINWKKKYIGTGDDEFFRDLEVLNSNELLMAGNQSAGIIYKANNNGDIQAGVQLPDRFVRDVNRETFGGFYAASTNFGNSQAYLEKFDSDLLLTWEVRLTGLSSISQVWEGLPGSGEIYATGMGNFGGLQRTVVVKLLESMNGVQVDWVKYLTVGNGYVGGSSWFLPSVKIAFTDARTIPGGFGQSCAFLSVSDLELETCEMATSFTDIVVTDPFPNSPDPLPFAEPFPPTVGVNVVASSALNWQQQAACSNDTCGVTISITPLNACGLVQVCANATGPGQYAYQWCSGESTQCITKQIPSCTPFEFCVSVTCSDGTVATATQSFTVVDNTPPVALCSGVGVDLDANCQATIVPSLIDGGSIDNCLIQSMTVSPSVVSGCGLHPVTLTVTDWCGNVSTCSTSVQTIEVKPPVIVCPPSKTIACNTNTGPNNCGTATATDNCDPSPIISFSDLTTGLMPCDGNIQRTWKAEDNCGNVSTCIQNITVFDNVPPVLTNCPQNITVTGTMGANGLCSANVQVASPTAADNCDLSVTLTNSFNNTANASGSYPSSTTTVTWTATDDCMHSSTCSFTVTVNCAAALEYCGEAVVTCFSGFINSTPSSGIDLNAAVVALVDLRNHATAPVGQLWASVSGSGVIHMPSWNATNMGQVFGVTIDNNQDIYLAASTVYGCQPAINPFGPAGPAGIYKIDLSGSGTPSVFVASGIPNTGSGLGNITWDGDHQQFFVTNYYDGKIYRINSAGVVQNSFDPFLPWTAAQTNAGGFVQLGERLWAIEYNHNDGRLYFSRWVEDRGASRRNATTNNEIYSVDIDNGSGNFTGSQSLEIVMDAHIDNYADPNPGVPYSMPVSDISFSKTGRMLLGEKSMVSDCGEPADVPLFYTNYSHQSRVFEYEKIGPTWVKTPGHGSPIDDNLKFKIGYPWQGNNCAGGVDYGYESFDPLTATNLPPCDSAVWSTGDALFCSSFPPTGVCNITCPGYPNNTVPNRIYGLQGNRAGGGDNCTGYLIDLDNEVCCYDKRRFGDIDIFKCGCTTSPTDFPCDSLWVTKEPLIFDPGTMPDTCCWDIDFHIHAGAAYLEVESLTPGVIFNNPALSSSFQWGGTPTGTLLPIASATPGHVIPSGDYNDALTFCLGNILTPQQDTQCIVFRWYVPGPTDIPYLACTDTCYFYCPPPVYGDTCLFVKNDSVACNPDKPLEYCYYFQVQNLSDFNASQVVLSNPTTGFAFKPCPPPNIPFTSSTIALPNPALNPGIEPDSCSPTLCVKIVATTPILTPTTFCFEAGLSSNDSCCHSPKKHCITLLPCCDPCEENSVVVHVAPPLDSCCHSLDIKNDCKLNFFTKLELKLLTPGVIFGSHSTGGPNPGDWYNPISTSTLIQWQHIFGFVPNGTTAGLINFCLDEIDMPSEVPQVVVLNWITTGLNGHDSIACSDTLIFDCPAVDNKCVDVLQQNIECLHDADGNVYYQLTMTIQNVSSPPHTANEVIFTQLGGPPITIFPNPIPIAPLPFNGITTIVTNIFGTGLNIGDKIIFEVRLHDSTFGGDNWCCFEGDSVCVFIPDCDSCHCAPASMTMTANGVTIPVTCNLTDQSLWPHLPCMSGSVTIAGNIGCIGNSPTANCQPFVTWSLTGPGGLIASGTQTSGSISQTFTASQVSAPGTYTFVTTTLCPGGGEACACYINWVQEPCGPQCFCAPADLVITQGGVSQTLFCTQGAPTPVLPCPPDDVTISGFFGCTSNPPPCTPSAVAWSLTGPLGFVCSGVLPNNSISLTFPQAQVTAHGSYFLTLSTLCPGAMDSCICTVRWIRECQTDSCCTNYDAFCALVAQGFTVVTDPVLCKATVTAPQFDSCHWFTTPPHLQGENALQVITDPDGMWMFNFTQSGVYTICVDVYEENANGICWQKEMCTTVDIACTNACVCGDFTDMNWRPFVGAPNQFISCGDSLMLPCQPSGFMFNFGGNFSCIGPNCQSTVNWELREQGTTNVVNSGTASGLGFTVSIPASDFVYPKVYELVFTGICNGVVCEECVFTILTTECPCHCGTFSSMFARPITGAPSIQLFCGEIPVQMPCPKPGHSIPFTGVFQCDGPTCLTTAQLDWKLVRLPSTTVAMGTTMATPFFGINILPNWYATPGSYQLQLSGYCGFDTCTCTLSFNVDCPNPCPCTPADIQALSAAVNQGFAVTKYPTSCKACFSPVALSDCEAVEWHLNTATGPLIGSSVGNQTICHTFPSSGTYTVVMVVTRLKPDGSLCEVFVKSRTVSITCLIIDDCTDSSFPNPTFSQGANGGGLGSGGTSDGWGAYAGLPLVVEGESGSFDAWTIQLSGNFDTSGVLNSMDPICLEKGAGTVSMRFGIKEQGIKAMLFVNLYRGDNFDLDNCEGSSCYELACIQLEGIDVDEWLELEIPYDLSNWDASDNCGDHAGLLIRPAVYVANQLSNDQGGTDNNTIVSLDNFCFDGMLVATDDPKLSQGIRLFPNPTSGDLTLQFKGTTPKAGQLQIQDLWGRVVLRETLTSGQQTHNFTLSNLPASVYFVKVLDGGEPIWVEKVVKQ